VRGERERPADSPDDNRGLILLSTAELPPILPGHLTPEVRGRAENF
jgi:hypothetical protein